MQVIYGALRAMGVIAGPATFRQLRAAGPRTPEQMIDRYRLACQPVRDLLVDYLRERQPALDYSTLQQLGYELGKLFWADIEQHHPGISASTCPMTSPARGSSGSRSRTDPAGPPRRESASAPATA